MRDKVDEGFVINLAVQLDQALDRVNEMAERMEELTKFHAYVLQQSRIQVTEKTIWDELDKYEAKLKQSKKFYDGYPGVPKKVFEQ
ncbi:hypothetical protein MYX84_00785 [Acidobacteria bacterium AH-259-O06]|nr:hypothetical protein [Acidobacteria bacterium AH-259-O06]